MNTLKRRVTVGLFSIALAAAACGGGSGSSSQSAKPPRGFAHMSPSLDTVDWVGDPLKGSTTLPGLKCPASFPYVLNLKFNPNTTFRLAPGIEFTNWKWGFDVNAQELSGILYNWPDKRYPYIAVGVYPPSTHDNTATYWIPFDETPWTMTLHCTSDPNNAVHQGNP
jgi:hypothetical protein